MFYLNFLKDKYKVPYICGTSKDENHYHIHEKPQTTLPKNTHLTPKTRWPNSNRPNFFWSLYLEEARLHWTPYKLKVRPWVDHIKLLFCSLFIYTYKRKGCNKKFAFSNRWPCSISWIWNVL